MAPVSFGEFIKSPGNSKAGNSKAGSGTTFTGEITPSRDNTAFQRWTDVAYTTWVDDSDGLLMQIQTLSQKYADEGSPEIVAWLRRKADRLRNSKYKPVTTDEL
jgi:hypothetical protein